jgi:hypothetical protein
MSEVFVLCYGTLLITELAMSSVSNVKTTAHGWLILSIGYFVTALLSSLIGYAGLCMIVCWCAYATCGKKTEIFRREMAITHPRRYVIEEEE